MSKPSAQKKPTSVKPTSRKAAPLPPPKKKAPPKPGAAAQKIHDAQQKLGEAGADLLGNLISWNVPDDLDVPRIAVRELLGTVNLEKLCPDLGPSSALRRAIAESRTPKDIVIEPFASADPAVCAHGIYRKIGQGESGDSLVPLARVRLSDDKAIDLPPEGLGGEEEGLQIAAKLAERANHLVEYATGRDVSAALVKVAAELHAAPLRDRGGFYLLPPATCPTWRSLVSRLEDLGFRMITIEIFDSGGNVAMMADAVKGSLEADLEQLQADLQKAQNEGMRESSMETRIKLIEELGAKAELYRSVLAGTAEGISAQMAELKAAFEKRLDEDRAAAAAGQKKAVAPDVAARRSEAARRANETRKAAKLAAAPPLAETLPA